MNIPINYQNERGKHFNSVKVIKIEKPLDPGHKENAWILHVETISKYYQPTFIMTEEELNEKYPEWRELIA